jgi:sorting nexin-25
MNCTTIEGCEICWRCAARELFLDNIPEVLSNLVGQQSARKGAMKVFETLQDPKLNKQLFYVSSALLFWQCVIR